MKRSWRVLCALGILSASFGSAAAQSGLPAIPLPPEIQLPQGLTPPPPPPPLPPGPAVAPQLPGGFDPSVLAPLLGPGLQQMISPGGTQRGTGTTTQGDDDAQQLRR